MYHNIGPDGRSYPDLSPSATSYFVRQSEFARHLAEVNNSGGHAMTYQQIGSFYDASTGQRRRGQRRAIFFTFDDGWAGTVETGGPLLEQHHYQAVVFVTTDFLGRRHFLSRGALSRLDQNIFRIGSHARTHRMLSLLSEPEIREELETSKKLLEDVTGYEVDFLSIPNGAVNARIRRIGLECGYRYIFDSEVRVNRLGGSPAAIGRVAVMHDTSISAFGRFVRQQITPERLRRAALQVPKRLLGLRRYEAFRRRLLGEKLGQSVTHEC